jgi:RNA recognition motif-containing protein
MTGNYGPAAAAAAAAAAGNTTGRTVYVGNLPPGECSCSIFSFAKLSLTETCTTDASVDELMNLVRFGPVESVRLLPEKSCVFISFLDGATAAAFHADATVKKLTLHGQELKIGWGKPSTVPSQVVQAIALAKATRNVYLGGLDDSLTESELRDDLCRFGPIDQVKIVRDKGIGFVHFLSIGAAMKVDIRDFGVISSNAFC